MTQQSINEMTIQELEAESEATMSIGEKIIRADQRRLDINRELLKRFTQETITPTKL